MMMIRNRERRTRILVFVPAYLPGFKAGGPIQSVKNLVEHLGDDHCFQIVTADRDRGDTEPYCNLLPGVWHSVGKARVYYLRSDQLHLRAMAQLMRVTPHDMVYLNSFLNPWFTTLPLLVRRLGLAPYRPTLLAPRGEFSQGALALKARKKRLFILASRAFRLHRGLAWHASSLNEAEDIRRVMGVKVSKVFMVPNLPRSSVVNEPSGNRLRGEPLDIAFFSRIVPKKNLLFVIEVLAQVRVPVALSIYGPREDQAYWARCAAAIAALPSHIRVSEHGPVPSSEVVHTLAQHELFFLPTRGENYGHVILEAMQAGLPVLISDQTPWRNLMAVGVGRDLPLADPKAFARSIECIAKLSTDDFASMRSRVLAYATEGTRLAESVEASRQMLRAVALSGNAP